MVHKCVRTGLDNDFENIHQYSASSNDLNQCKLWWGIMEQIEMGIECTIEFEIFSHNIFEIVVCGIATSLV